MQEAQERSLPGPEGGARVLRVSMPSPLGLLGVDLLGLVLLRVRIGIEGAERAGFVPLHRVEASEELDEVFGRLAEYLAGARRRAEVAYDLAPSGLNGFARRILKETAKIPYGRTRTYSEIAEAANRPEAAPEIPAILAQNPLPIVIPCHRAVAPGGSLGGYVSCPEHKRWLLDLERRGLESS
jgi:methylated-DNA-[protein]-cysteine S-methyltransferase